MPLDPPVRAFLEMLAAGCHGLSSTRAGPPGPEGHGLRTTRGTSGLSPALILTAEFDVLRDEAEAYARRLQADGVEVEVRRFDGLIHGFFLLAGTLDAGRRAIGEAAAALRAALAPQLGPGRGPTWTLAGPSQYR